MLRLIEGEAFAIRRYPVTVEEFIHLLTIAGGVPEGSGAEPVPSPTWDGIEQRLSQVLHAFVQRVTGEVADARTANAIVQAVLRASEVARTGASGEQMLIAISDAFAAEAHARRVA